MVPEWMAWVAWVEVVLTIAALLGLIIATTITREPGWGWVALFGLMMLVLAGWLRMTAAPVAGFGLVVLWLVVFVLAVFVAGRELVRVVRALR